MATVVRSVEDMKTRLAIYNSLRKELEADYEQISQTDFVEVFSDGDLWKLYNEIGAVLGRVR